MQTRLNRSSVLFMFALVSTSLLVGCMADPDAGGDGDGDAAETDQQATPEAEPQAQNGLCCWGHCNTSGPFVMPDVTENCRAHIVAACHSADRAFLPNGDAWWGTCP